MDENGLEKPMTANDFKRKFSFPSKDFPEPSILINAVGISVKKIYPDGYASIYDVEISRRKPQQ